MKALFITLFSLAASVVYANYAEQYMRSFYNSEHAPIALVSIMLTGIVQLVVMGSAVYIYGRISKKW